MPPTLRSADSLRQTLADVIAPLSRLEAELSQRWVLAVDVARARTRLESGVVAFEPLETIGAAGDLLVPFVRATVALERAGLISDPEAMQARERRYQIMPLIVSWLGGEPAPRDRARAAARRAAAMIAGSILRRASALLRAPAAPAGEVGSRSVERALEEWDRPLCFCCGGAPDFALRQGGTRWLVCARCDSTWRTSALGCLGCGAHEAPTIARVTCAALGYQLTICNSCGRYLKEPTEARPLDPLLERALTSELDAAAEARGLRL
ncbi:MAG: formate dehydrogenase accessory protein FdhE [Gemmatimonadaceae bacterium]